MPHTLQIVKTHDFVRLDADGKPDIQRSREVLQGVARQCIQKHIDCALLDVRDLESTMTLNDLYSLARAFNEMGFARDHRLAVLHRYSSTARAEFFAMCANERGWNVRAFDSFEDAIEWFGEPRGAPGT